MKILVIYSGISYREKYEHCHGQYFRIDMSYLYNNHEENIHKPLEKMGFEVDKTIITNLHNNIKLRYIESIYKTIPLQYSEPTQQQFDACVNYFKSTYPKAINFGFPWQGIRFLNLATPLPEYDFYLFLRCDTKYKFPVSELGLDFGGKINFLWKEMGAREIESIKSPHGAYNNYYRTNGNFFHLVPNKYIKGFVSHYWMEHCMLYALLRDMDGFSLNDVHFVCGDECYDSDTFVCNNPIFEVPRFDTNF